MHVCSQYVLHMGLSAPVDLTCLCTCQFPVFVVYGRIQCFKQAYSVSNRPWPVNARVLSYGHAYIHAVFLRHEHMSYMHAIFCTHTHTHYHFCSYRGCIWAYIHTCSVSKACTHIRYTYVICTYSLLHCIHTHIHTYMTYIHTVVCIHTHIHTYMSYVHTVVCIHTHIHTYMSYIHTVVCIHRHIHAYYHFVLTVGVPACKYHLSNWSNLTPLASAICAPKCQNQSAMTIFSRQNIRLRLPSPNSRAKISDSECHDHNLAPKYQAQSAMAIFCDQRTDQ